MKRVTRYDYSKLDGVKFTGEGFMQCDAVLARTGVQVYRDAAGNIRRELRLPEDVFNKDSMDSAKGRPFTNGHPTIGLLSPDTATMYSKGAIGDKIAKEDGPGGIQLLKGNITIWDKQTIQDAKNGKQQISQGYDCDLEESSGIYQPTGEAYDVIQRNIRHNHTALIDRARAGGVASLRLDSEDAEMVDGESKSKETKMAKVLVAGKEFDASDELSSALKKEREEKEEKDKTEKAEKDKKDKKHDELITEHDALKAEHSKVTARADAAEAEVKSMKVKLDAAPLTDAQVQEKVTRRIGILEVARKLVKKDKAEKLDGMTDVDVMKETILAQSPDFKFDGKDAVYVQARFDAIAELIGKMTPGQLAADIISRNRAEAGKTDSVEDPEKHRQDAMKADDSNITKKISDIK